MLMTRRFSTCQVPKIVSRDGWRMLPGDLQGAQLAGAEVGRERGPASAPRDRRQGDSASQTSAYPAAAATPDQPVSRRSARGSGGSGGGSCRRSSSRIVHLEKRSADRGLREVDRLERRGVDRIVDWQDTCRKGRPAGRSSPSGRISIPMRPSISSPNPGTQGHLGGRTDGWAARSSRPAAGSGAFCRATSRPTPGGADGLLERLRAGLPPRRGPGPHRRGISS